MQQTTRYLAANLHRMVKRPQHLVLPNASRTRGFEDHQYESLMPLLVKPLSVITPRLSSLLRTRTVEAVAVNSAGGVCEHLRVPRLTEGKPEKVPKAKYQYLQKSYDGTMRHAPLQVHPSVSSCSLRWHSFRVLRWSLVWIFSCLPVTLRRAKRVAEVAQHDGPLFLYWDSYPAYQPGLGKYYLVVLLLLAAWAKVYTQYGIQ